MSRSVEFIWKFLLFTSLIFLAFVLISSANAQIQLSNTNPKPGDTVDVNATIDYADCQPDEDYPAAVNVRIVCDYYCSSKPLQFFIKDSLGAYVNLNASFTTSVLTENPHRVISALTSFTVPKDILPGTYQIYIDASYRDRHECTKYQTNNGVTVVTTDETPWYFDINGVSTNINVNVSGNWSAYNKTVGKLWPSEVYWTNTTPASGGGQKWYYLNTSNSGWRWSSYPISDATRFYTFPNYWDSDDNVNLGYKPYNGATTYIKKPFYSDVNVTKALKISDTKMPTCYFNGKLLQLNPYNSYYWHYSADVNISTGLNLLACISPAATFNYFDYTFTEVNGPLAITDLQAKGNFTLNSPLTFVPSIENATHPESDVSVVMEIDYFNPNHCDIITEHVRSCDNLTSCTCELVARQCPSGFLCILSLMEVCNWSHEICGPKIEVETINATIKSDGSEFSCNTVTDLVETCDGLDNCTCDSTVENPGIIHALIIRKPVRPPPCVWTHEVCPNKFTIMFSNNLVYVPKHYATYNVTILAMDNIDGDMDSYFTQFEITAPYVPPPNPPEPQPVSQPMGFLPKSGAASEVDSASGSNITIAIIGAAAIGVAALAGTYIYTSNNQISRSLGRMQGSLNNATSALSSLRSMYQSSVTQNQSAYSSMISSKYASYQEQLAAENAAVAETEHIKKENEEIRARNAQRQLESAASNLLNNLKNSGMSINQELAAMASFMANNGYDEKLYAEYKKLKDFADSAEPLSPALLNNHWSATEAEQEGIALKAQLGLSATDFLDDNINKFAAAAGISKDMAMAVLGTQAGADIFKNWKNPPLVLPEQPTCIAPPSESSQVSYEEKSTLDKIGGFFGGIGAFLQMDFDRKLNLVSDVAGNLLQGNIFGAAGVAADFMKEEIDSLATTIKNNWQTIAAAAVIGAGIAITAGTLGIGTGLGVALLAAGVGMMSKHIIDDYAPALNELNDTYGKDPEKAKAYYDLLRQYGTTDILSFAAGYGGFNGAAAGMGAYARPILSDYGINRNSLSNTDAFKMWWDINNAQYMIQNHYPPIAFEISFSSEYGYKWLPGNGPADAIIPGSGENVQIKMWSKEMFQQIVDDQMTHSYFQGNTPFKTQQEFIEYVKNNDISVLGVPEGTPNSFIELMNQNGIEVEISQFTNNQFLNIIEPINPEYVARIKALNAQANGASTQPTVTTQGSQQPPQGPQQPPQGPSFSTTQMVSSQEFNNYKSEFGTKLQGYSQNYLPDLEKVKFVKNYKNVMAISEDGKSLNINVNMWDNVKNNPDYYFKHESMEITKIDHTTITDPKLNSLQMINTEKKYLLDTMNNDAADIPTVKNDPVTSKQWLNIHDGEIEETMSYKNAYYKEIMKGSVDGNKILIDIAKNHAVLKEIDPKLASDLSNVVPKSKTGLFNNIVKLIEGVVK